MKRLTIVLLATFVLSAAVYSQSVDTVYKEGVALLQAGKYIEAAEKFRTVIAVRKDVPTAYYFLGLCYQNQKMHKESILSLQEAVRIKAD